MLAKVHLLVACLDFVQREGEWAVMSLNSVAGKTCVWCVASTTLEEKIKGIKSVAGKTCAWCVAATMAALTLLAVTWTVILVGN